MNRFEDHIVRQVKLARAPPDGLASFVVLSMFGFRSLKGESFWCMACDYPKNGKSA